MIRVLTLNAWHGHVPKSALAVLNLEPPGHKAKRTSALLEEVRALSPDAIMLQECLPQPGFTDALARELGYDHVSKVCNSGVRIFGIGLPTGIGHGEGVSILARKGLGLRVVAVRRLSGVGFATPKLAVQFGQLRFALAAEIEVEGRVVGLVNTHLRYAYPVYETFERAWRELAARGALRGEPSRMLQRMVKSSLKVRDSELWRLADLVRGFTHRGVPVVVGADFNLDHDTEQMLKFGSELGLVNVLPTVDARGHTWDPVGNPNIAFSMKSTHPDGTPKNPLWLLTAHYDGVKQNPDHLMIGGALPKQALKEGGLAMHRSVAGVFPSDHYGIWADVAL